MSRHFIPDTDTAVLTDKVILITGGYSGLGEQSALQLAKHGPAQIWITGRSSSKAKPTLDALRAASPRVAVHFLEMDLASFESIREASRFFVSNVSRLDILLLNAGVMGGPPSLTKDGYEAHFGINHMGHALLLQLLEPLLDKTDAPRIVLVSSDGHRHARELCLDTVKSVPQDGSSLQQYLQSKLANVVYAKEVAKRHPQWTTVSIHPGNVKTDLHRHGGGTFVVRLFKSIVLPVIGVSPAKGALNQLWAATASADQLRNGDYYEPVGVSGKIGTLAKNSQLGSKLWDWTEKELHEQLQK